ncbi:MAG: T9SS type A sorting domain-containing protein, partial [Verrucomicrobia bacterium]|nr:T9SS type A sorting domain-containing protein [Verrucomicrobiota bacterium]
EEDIFRFSTEPFMTFDITKGDINKDGSVDVVDVVRVIDIILQVSAPTGEQEYASDFNNDLAVNVADVVAITNEILGISTSNVSANIEKIQISLAEKAGVEAGFLSVPIEIGTRDLLHGLQITLKYDASKLRPLQPHFGDQVSVLQHARDGKVTYVFSNLDDKPLSLPRALSFRFEQIHETAGAPAKIFLGEVVAAGAGGQVHKSVLGNSVAATGFIPKRFALHQNYPNPFNPATTLRFDLPDDSKVNIEIFNIIGQRVRHLLRGQDMLAGQHSLRWNGRDDGGKPLSTGVYVVRLKAADFVKSKKVMLLK